jgi:hypothetical protein
MDSNTSATVDPSNMYNYLNGLATNPIIFAILAVIILGYVVLFFSLGNSSEQSSMYSNIATTSSDSSTTNSGFIFLIAFVVIVLIAYNVLLYFFSIDIMASISNLFQGGNKINVAIQEKVKEGDIEPSTVVPEITRKPQVFNIPGNYYGYEDAKALCSAYGAELANYEQVEKAYNRGAEWCNYGWSDGQMALFPTQKETYAKLQEIPGHENDCGRAGVNGGYIANPKLKFGVNCFGYKPKITNEEEEMMQNTQPYPKTEKDILMEKRVDYWKGKLDEILVSPFNYDTWSRI